MILGHKLVEAGSTRLSKSYISVEGSSRAEYASSYSSKQLFSQIFQEILNSNPNRVGSDPMNLGNEGGELLIFDVDWHFSLNVPRKTPYFKGRQIFLVYFVVILQN